MFCFGIEHEVAFLNDQGKFADFHNTKFADFQQIVDKLPIYPTDYPQLRVGDAGIKKKRWYIEGFERFSDSEEVIDCVAKGIEIRTTIHSTIQGAIDELTASFVLLSDVAANFGLSPVLASFNPYTCVFKPQPPLNDFEIRQLQAYPDEQTAHIYMVSYGPDLNISMANLSTERLIDIGKKLTYYSPYIIPFSYSSPFYNGGLWAGLSVRTFIRTGKRSATLVFVETAEELIKSVPSLTKIARIPSEVGRIEFKACDSCDNFAIYAGLLALLKGLVLDETLPGRAIIPDANLHQISAKYGFENEDIFLNSTKILQVAEIALKDDPDLEFLTPLKVILSEKKTKSHELIKLFQNLGSIEATLKKTYIAGVRTQESGIRS
ncbi:glutamate--cysteine ligase [Anabaena sp. UHCC 0187]|uniref:glutamate--cysteine ligase n=1 Tax=Anabaena sp. UHCC 0187 TaxID=2590018 RepID=UPI001448730F|nr:glutamate--cysteine ligase [Anabaena sp. UHCC 0187]MDP5017591.1 glutamate--cysteine ligase [Dolichospermum sp.]MTJ13889.1 glutamate--cysteine ligase [Anabaena sp. UHCC 0187]